MSKERDKRWLTAGITIAGGGAGGGIGAAIGASAGIAIAGTAIAATLPFALAAGAIGGLTAYVVRDKLKKK